VAQLQSYYTQTMSPLYGMHGYIRKSHIIKNAALSIFRIVNDNFYLF